MHDSYNLNENGGEIRMSEFFVTPIVIYIAEYFYLRFYWPYRIQGAAPTKSLILAFKCIVIVQLAHGRRV